MERKQLGKEHARLSNLSTTQLVASHSGYSSHSYYPSYETRIRFPIPACNREGFLFRSNCLWHDSDMNDKLSLPRISFMAVGVREKADIICREVPHLLVQAIIAFEKNPELMVHSAFTLRTVGTKVQINSAAISRAYIDSIEQFDPLEEVFTVLCCGL